MAILRTCILYPQASAGSTLFQLVVGLEVISQVWCIWGYLCWGEDVDVSIQLCIRGANFNCIFSSGVFANRKTLILTTLDWCSCRCIAIDQNAQSRLTYEHLEIASTTALNIRLPSSTLLVHVTTLEEAMAVMGPGLYFTRILRRRTLSPSCFSS
jgi:hypothetical protein